MTKLIDAPAITALMTLNLSQVERAIRMNNTAKALPDGCVRLIGATFAGMNDTGEFVYDVVYTNTNGEAVHNSVRIKYFRHDPSQLTVPLAF